MGTDLTAASVDLLQHLIRSACVNDGTAESGQEVRNVDILRGYLEGVGLDMEVREPTPGRSNLIARIEGTDPNAPTVCLCGHTDVVPVSPEGWKRDPFGGEVVDGEVWGRGAIDMLNLTATMAVATRALAAGGFRPKGTLIYLACADEEAGSHHGVEWLAEHDYDSIKADYVLTESGGLPRVQGDDTLLTVTVSEKGVMWRRLRVQGTPGHGSMPYGTDNALVKAARVVDRLASYKPAAIVGDTFREYIAGLGLPAASVEALTDPARVDDELPAMDPRMAKIAHACTHTTFSPNVIHGGVKTNVIPDIVDIDVDIRVLPGETDADVAAHLRAALGDLSDDVHIKVLESCVATESPREGPLWDAMTKVVQGPYPGARLVPRMTAGGTDARFYRDNGATAYGFGLFSREVSAEEFASRFHGHNERIDVESLRLTTEMWMALIPALIG